MDERIMTRGFPWREPAHPGLIRLFDDLVTIYRVIRERLQERIDAAFDTASSGIGFVVTTTIPATLAVGPKGEGKWSLPEALKGSLFEKGILEALNPDPTPWKVAAGEYKLYVLWYDALRLKLRKDWLEPVHYLRAEVFQQIRQAARLEYEVQEPAHWFHPDATIPSNEKLVISVIDEVYPELRLAERIAFTRQSLRKVLPEVQEPAHFHGTLVAERALREIAQLFWRVRPDIPEPAHFRFGERDVLSEVGAVLKKYGF
jgi:hypothetical protein